MNDRETKESGIIDYCGQVCGGGQCGDGPQCLYGIDPSSGLPPARVLTANPREFVDERTRIRDLPQHDNPFAPCSDAAQGLQREVDDKQGGKLSQIPLLQVGDEFTLTTDELDLDENSEERTTPAGSVWRVVELEPHCDPIMQYSVVCEATGGWIHLTHDEIAKAGCISRSGYAG